ncbi:MAG: hypothetical protein A07HR60_01975 [uncultured archaeon A07HR60]|nr:MAG: hypothetical protein A07HR60_01975 [uncultured archaeon A07HR60]
MGNKAVLPHCGDNEYKLICSAGMGKPGVWSWTVVRKNRAGNEYEYLTIDGGVAQRQGQPRDQTIRTVIKLYEYQFANKGTITESFRQQSSRVITSSPFRPLLHPSRGFLNAGSGYARYR